MSKHFNGIMNFLIITYILLFVSDDKVANVRYSLCNIMPSIVNIFKMWTEKPLVDKLIDTINKLLIDGDRTVQEQRPLLEYCNTTIGHILRVIILILKLLLILNSQIW